MKPHLKQAGPFLTGVFELQDTHGLPIEVSHDIAKERGLRVDWGEALCRCWLNDPLKYDSFVRQASLLAGVDLDAKFKETGAAVIALHPEFLKAENPVDETCRWLLNQKEQNNNDN